MNNVKERLEYLRGELRAERISMSELLELQSLVPSIDRSDVELLEAAGVPEYCPACERPYWDPEAPGDPCDTCGAGMGTPSLPTSIVPVEDHAERRYEGR